MPVGTNLIGAWTKVGTGTMTVNSTTGAVTITAAGDQTSTIARQEIATEAGKRYSLTYNMQTSATAFRIVGTTPGASDIVGPNVSSHPETRLSFTATTPSIWIDFSRSATFSTTLGSIRFEEAPEGHPIARRLNGWDQFFRFDAAAAGRRRWNNLLYIGGWIKFQYKPTAGVYLADFTIPDAGASGGQQRARIVYDPAVPKIMASNAGSAAGGNKYAENAINVSGKLNADEWHYVGMALASDGAVTVVYDSTIGGTTSGTGVPEVGQYLNVLNLGAREASTPTNFSPAIYSDWIWCEGFVPTNDQIGMLAAGYRPSDIEGFAPTFYWPMDGTDLIESSIATAGDLTAPTAPGVVVGPSYLAPASDDALPIIIF